LVKLDFEVKVARGGREGIELFGDGHDFGLVVGVSLSPIDVIPLTTTARWFVRRRGMMTGLVKVNPGAGQLIMPLLAGHIFDIARSYQLVFPILAGVGIAGLFLTLFLKPAIRKA
jgi:hypothetical protein